MDRSGSALSRCEASLEILDPPLAANSLGVRSELPARHCLEILLHLLGRQRGHPTLTRATALASQLGGCGRGHSSLPPRSPLLSSGSPRACLSSFYRLGPRGLGIVRVFHFS